MMDSGTFALAVEKWPPAAQAAALAVLTFVQEDAPTVSAALLSATGRIAVAPAFLGCFLGIWIGDALLYMAARCFGRPLLQRRWAQRFIDESAVQRAENWFAKNGSWLLVSSRIIPGTRLPTYLAAGFLRVPFGSFLAITGVAVVVWTTLIFLLAKVFGGEMRALLDRSMWFLALAVVVALVALRLIGKLSDRAVRRRVVASLLRWKHWEFWPAWFFYAPVGAWYLWLAIRYRSFTLPSAANPGIYSGGLVGESKLDTLRDLGVTSPESTAAAYLLESGATGHRRQRLECLLAQKAIVFPFILKPDVGQRGVGVKLVPCWEQAEIYFRNTDAPLVCQQYVAGPHEVGVFYYRFPHETRGRIFAITEKVFPFLVGDGVRTMEALIWSDSRARLIAGKYLSRIGDKRNYVLPAGARLRLVEAGNHAQGCIFRDGMHLWSDMLEQRIDEISRKLDGFFIGRYDIRYSSDDELRAGRGFQIIELNGAASEATSIYDSRNSLLAAYRTLFRQWELVFAIGAANRARGSRSTPLAELWRGWRRATALAATYPAAD